MVWVCIPLFIASRVGGVGLFIMSPWLGVLCCCFPLIVLIVGVRRLGL